MSATINFIAQGGSNFNINNLNNSGLGFFGAGGFGNSVIVGAWQGTTFVTDGNGINQGPQVNNVMWVHPNSGQLPGGTNVNLANLPNFQSTLNINFQNPGSPVRLQNSKVFIYDRVSTSNLASGTTTAIANVIHPVTTQAGGGSGDLSWEYPNGSSYILLSQYNNGVPFSPGQSGYGINGGSTVDQTHDYFIAITASPNSVGSKTQFGLLFSTDYL